MQRDSAQAKGSAARQPSRGTLSSLQSRLEREGRRVEAGRSAPEMAITTGLSSSPRAWRRGWTVTRLLSFAAASWVLVTQVEVGAWTYHYGDKQDYSWELARNFCRTFYTDLVAIQNQKEIAHLNSSLPRHITYYWIGIRKINKVWTWVGTSKALTKEAVNWAAGEPNNRGRNQDCVEIYIKREREAGKWNDEPCQKKKRALCYQVVTCKSLGPGPACSHPLGEFSYNSTCTFQCPEGFELRGLDTLQCLASGNWTAVPPECAAVTCPALAAPGRGWLNCTHWHGDFAYSSTCAFSCETGFVRRGAETLECTALGQWTGPAPRCEAVTCPALAAPGRGWLNCTHWHGDFAYNSTCTFSCETGFVRRGAETLECTALGQWTEPAPRCAAVMCPALTTPERGWLNCTHWHGDFAYNSTCAFSCETGFVRRGAETLECTALGQWTGPAPRCAAVTCPALAAPGRGWLNCTHWHGDFAYSSTCAFSCETGFVRRGAEMLECTALGQWTGPAPRCEAVTCPALTAPGRGWLNCTHWHGDFAYNSTCAFSCETGFVRRGAETLECTALGQWTGPAPRCEAVKCPALAAPGRGLLNCTHWHGDFAYNSTCTFSCETGFVQRGVETLECTALGQWTEPAPRCEAVTCPALAAPGRGWLNCTHWHGDFAYNSTCTFSCETGFVRRGAETLECTALGQWTEPAPRCEAVKCLALDTPERGQLTCSQWHGNFTYNSTCAFSCEMGFVRTGPNLLECTARGEWTAHPPHCEVTRCPELRGLEPVLMNCSHPLGPFSYRSACRFRCTPGYFLNGTSRVQCQPDGQWSDKMPACQEEAASYFKQVLLYMGVGAVALVAVLLTSIPIVLLIRRLSDKEETKRLLNPTSDLGAAGVFTNAAFDSTL
ncbi:P-selectin-like isoform X2 [Pelodiscus sinensis]|uniref:P-selectin-like isoform X2 n=1 Tax=Pelodiscus sinensis TaxID=13735 RepID=UPI003F6C2CD3